MKNLLFSVLAGAVGAILASSLVGKSFATVDAASVRQAITEGICQVQVSYPRLSGGTRCFSGEVMTGYWNESIYCSDLTVSCN
ncbi:MAG: hypothetical protein RIQ81_1867 [Pseudomonadota bacterium]|jgi:hypothetical protein